jgi:hypothetical protein
MCSSGIVNYKNEAGILAVIAGDALVHVIIYMQWGLYNY